MIKKPSPIAEKIGSRAGGPRQHAAAKSELTNELKSEPATPILLR